MLPLVVIELKNPADENATAWSAYQQLQTYQAQIPALFATNSALVASDAVQARFQHDLGVVRPHGLEIAPAEAGLFDDGLGESAHVMSGSQT